MSIKVSYRYQLSAHFKALATFYLIVISVSVLLLSVSMISISASPGESLSGEVSGLEISTLIFIFIAGCNSFREEFGMLMQNGVSRKTLFIGRMLTSVTVSFGMAIIDKLIYFLYKLLVSAYDQITFSSLFDMLNYFGNNNSIGIFTKELISFVFCFSLYLSATALGYLLTTIFYRLSKGGRTAFCVSIPVGLFVVLPLIDSTIANGKVFTFIFRTLDKAFGLSAHQPVYGIITCCLSVIVLSALSWLPVRRAYVKE